MIIGRKPVARETEEIGDPVMEGCEPRRRSQWLQSIHDPFSSPRRRVDVSARSFEPFHATRESEPVGDRQVSRSRIRFEKCKHPISVGVAHGAANWYTVGAEGIS
jgi:hypothetical protein